MKKIHGLLNKIVCSAIFSAVLFCAPFYRIAAASSYWTEGGFVDGRTFRTTFIIAVTCTILGTATLILSIVRRIKINRLYEKSEREASIRDFADIALAEYDVKSQKMVYSENLEKHFKGDYSSGEGLATVWLANGMISRNDYDALLDFFEDTVKKRKKNDSREKDTFYVKLLTADESWKWYRIESCYVFEHTDGRDRLVVSITNVDEDMKQRELLRYRAEFDDVAGIYNKHTFFGATRKMISSHPDVKYVIVRWDIDRFKMFNDLFGIESGDWLLRAIGDELKKNYIKSGTYGYLGSDHFVMCMPADSIDIHALVNIVTVFLRGLPYNFNFQPRFGLYEIGDTTVSIELMCDRALLALRSVKGSYQKPYAYYDESLRKELLFEQQIVNEMSSALEEKQFSIYLQPQYSHSTGKIVSAEALVRWNHPTLGTIAPDIFIPLFEKNGFITQMDKYVWEEACRCMRRWADEKKHEVPLSVSVNISRMDIYDNTLSDTLESLLKKYELSPKMLKLEITESAYVENPVQMIEVVKNLRKRGFIIQMDDFGSGYSSLNILKDVPVDVLKLDLKFLAGEQNVERGGTILNSVVRMAQWLNLEVIAEGVETLQQANYLQSIGCDIVQGYLYSKPIPVREFEKLIEKEGTAEKKSFSGMDVIVDSGEFWNPDAQFSLVFQSFLNGAAIVEQSGDVYECTRKNTKFCEVADVSEEFFERYKTSLMTVVFEEDRPCVREMFQKAARTREDACCECRFINPHNKEKGMIYLKMNTRLVAKSDTRNVFYLIIENITNEKQQELINEEQAETLRKHSQFIQTVYSAVPYGIAQFTYEEIPRFVDINKVGYQIFGFKSKKDMRAAVERFGSSIIHADDRDMARRALKKCRKTGKSADFLVRVSKTEDSVIYLKGMVDIIELPDETKYFQFAFLDATEQVLAESERNINEYSCILLSVFDEINEINLREDTVTLISTKKTSVTENRYHGVAKTFDDWCETFVYPDDRELFRKITDFERLNKTDANMNENEALEARLINQKSGQYQWYSLTSLRVADGLFLFCGTDIHERKTAMEYYNTKTQIEEHQREQERYRYIVEESGMTVIEFNLVTGGVYASDSIERFAFNERELDKNKYNLEEILRYVYQDDAPTLKKLFVDCMRGKKRNNTELRLKMSDGTYKWCKVTAMFATDGGELTRMLLTLTVIDDEVNIKNSLEQTTENLNNIISNLPVGLGIYRVEDGKLSAVYISDRACQMFGLTRAYYYKNFRDTSSQLYKESEKFVDQARKALTDNNHFESDIYLKELTGQLRWVHIVGNIVRGDENSLECYSMFTDVTDSVLNEEKKHWQEEKYRILAQTTRAVTFDYDAGKDTLTYSIVTPKHGYVERKIRGYSSVILRGDSIHTDYKEGFYNVLKEASRNQVNGTYDFIANNFGAGYVWCRASYVSVLNSEDGQYRVIGRIDNVQKEKEAELEVIENQIYRKAITANTLIVFEYSLNHNDINIISEDRTVAIEYFEWEKYFTGEESREYIHPDDFERIREKVTAEALKNGFGEGVYNYSLQLRLKKRDGNFVWVSVKLHMSGDSDENDIKGIAYVKVIDEKKRSEDALRLKAEHDGVTGLFNRATTEELVNSLLLNNNGHSVFVIFDIDNFKNLNDSYGHLLGDKVLKSVSTAIQRSCRKTDVVGRIGGDEFVAFLNGAGLTEAQMTVDRILAKVREEERAFDIDRQITLSAGLAVTEAQDTHFDRIFERADKALYEAKNAGKNGYAIYRDNAE